MRIIQFSHLITHRDSCPLCVRKYLPGFLQVKCEQVHTDEFIHSCFWQNESLKLKHTQHTAFSDYKHLAEWAVTEENNSDGSSILEG